MNPDPHSEGPRAGRQSQCRPARALLVRHVQGDTYVIDDEGDLSLADGATLTLLLKQLTGRDTE